MDALQKSRLSSYKLIVKVSKENQEIVDTIPYFAQGVIELDGYTQGIDGLSVLQNKDLTGITDDKNEDQKQCRKLLHENSSALQTYANKKGDKILLALIEIPKGKISKLDTQDLVTRCKAVILEMRKLPETDLAGLGLTTADIDDFEAYTNNLDSKRDLRKGAVIEQKSDNQQINQLFEKAQKVKTEVLDKLAPQFERKYPAFYSKYKDAATVHYKHYAKKENTDSNTESTTDTKKED